MTEAEWRACDDPVVLLRALGRRATVRKLRLLAAACWRAPWSWPGLPEREVIAAHNEATADEPDSWGAIEAAAFDQLIQQWWDVYEPLYESSRGPSDAGGADASRETAALLRDVICFERPPQLSDRARCDAQVRALARAIYGQRGLLDHASLAVLSDALEESGCADSELLGHLRGPGPHVRGCWALDLVLGKQ